MNIRRFRALHVAGATYAEIARECGVDWRTVRNPGSAVGGQANGLNSGDDLRKRVFGRRGVVCPRPRGALDGAFAEVRRGVGPSRWPVRGRDSRVRGAAHEVVRGHRGDHAAAVEG